MFRRVGIAGGVYGTATGLYDLYQQGNPIDAFQAEGAGYVADVASTAFSASSTAFLLAPNPVTGTLVVVTGLVWAGAEIWDHREQIADWTSDRVDDTVRLAGGAWNASTAAFDVGLDAAGDAWDAGTEFVSEVGGTVSDVRDEVFETGGEFVSDVATAADPRNWF